MPAVLLCPSPPTPDPPAVTPDMAKCPQGAKSPLVENPDLYSLALCLGFGLGSVKFAFEGIQSLPDTSVFGTDPWEAGGQGKDGGQVKVQRGLVTSHYSQQSTQAHLKL